MMRRKEGRATKGREGTVVAFDDIDVFITTLIYLQYHVQLTTNRCETETAQFAQVERKTQFRLLP